MGDTAGVVEYKEEGNGEVRIAKEEIGIIVIRKGGLIEKLLKKMQMIIEDVIEKKDKDKQHVFGM